jgi:hypothetical protein
LRARYYDPATGRFNRLDPFFGNLNDPQSLHKYLYTHADPISNFDPSGQNAVMATLAMILGGGIVGLGISEMFVDNSFDALRVAIFGGVLMANPIFGAGFLLGLYFSSWNWKRSYDYAHFWILMNGAEAMYDAGDHSMITENIDKRPSEMFYDLRWGNGEYHPRNYYFGICPMTLAMRKHSNIINEKEVIKTALRHSPNNYIPTFSDLNNESQVRWYQVPVSNIFSDAVIGLIDIIGSYQPFFRGSDAYEARLLESFLGTYTYNWEIKSVDWEQKQAVVRFRVGNGTGIRSLTRIPAFDGISVFGDQSSGWFATTTQFFMWEEIICF